MLDITTGLTDIEALSAWKTNLHTLVANRLHGNDVLMFEIDYYTGSRQSANAVGNSTQIVLYGIGDLFSSSNPVNVLATFNFDKKNGFSNIDPNKNPHFNTWLKFIAYLDYPNKKVYYYLPFLNIVSVNDFLQYETSPNLIQDFPISNIIITVLLTTGSNEPQIYTRNRFDNIKLTALAVVPPNIVALNINEQLAAKFNIYPNPATNIVNISNSENMLVNQVTIYDLAGKEIKSQMFANEANIQFKVEDLAKGTYLLHLQTNEGTAVKKLVKK